MFASVIPLAILALIIIGTIVGTGWLIWTLSAEGQDSKNFKRVNKGRRRSDQ